MDFEFSCPPKAKIAPECFILSLSGGGFRGLFTARILELFEQEAGVPCREVFDFIAGTSIGGIIAIALALGRKAAEIRSTIEERGQEIFRARHAFAGWVGARYSPGGLRKVLSEILGADAALPLDQLTHPCLVTTVQADDGTGRVFRSQGLAGRTADHIPLIEAALATSAAPGFFPVHVYDGRSYVDGGLVANAPDLISVVEAYSRLRTDLSRIHVLSIGTASTPILGPTVRPRRPGRLSWIVRHNLFELTLAAQEAIAKDEAGRLLGRRFLRIDAVPAKRIRLDMVDRDTVLMLKKIAEDCVSSMRGIERDSWLKFRRHRSVMQLNSV